MKRKQPTIESYEKLEILVGHEDLNLKPQLKIWSSSVKNLSESVNYT